jgi:hypothetical protein
MATAAALKDEICARSNSRKQVTVEGLWQVLEEMRRMGISAFTIAQVGRHAEAAGILHTQTLRNTGGEDYRSLINAFAQEIGAAITSVPATTATPLETAIDNIADLDIRTRLRMVLVENVRQREEIGRLRQAFKHMQPASTVETSSVELLSPPDPRLDIAPLEKFLAVDWIDERRWSVEANGAIYDEINECVAPVGFVDSLKALLDFYKCNK